MKIVQLDIFETPRLPVGRSRRKDPITSKQAGEKNQSALNQQAAKVLSAIRVVEGGTRGEIGRFLAELEGISFHEAIARVSRRAPDLAKAGLVRRGEPRKCHFMGSNQTTWYSTEQGKNI